MTTDESARPRALARELLDKAGIVVSRAELAGMELASFGLGDFERTGLALVVYVNNDRYCARELVMLPGQTCPEHRHLPVADAPGKTETFRCRWGRVCLYVPGPPEPKPKAVPPAGSEEHYTVFHQVVLSPGDQYTVPPDTLHWFQAGPEGAVISEFSSTTRDESDLFTDPRIRR